MRKTRRADSRQGRHVPEDWNFRALLPQRPQDEQQKAHSGPESLSSTATTSERQHLHPKSQRNPEWVLRKQRKRGYNKRFAKKSELSTPNSEVGSLNSDSCPSNSEAAPSNVEESSLSAQLGSLSFGEQVNVEMGKVKGDGLEMKKDESDDANRDCEDDNEVDDPMTRLEGLRLGVVEPELSEELLKINDQLQEDELLALESIYGDNAFVLDRQTYLRVFQIHIHIDAPVSFTITTNLNSTGGPKMKSDSSHDFLYSFKLKYLPPIVLTCLLPKSYPSHLPPYFAISVQWLDSIRISSLCSMLDSIWMGQLGQEVIYQWAEWLHDFSLSYLGVVDEITLGPYGIKHTGDRRAISRSISPDVDIPSLRNYNHQQCHENFQNTLHECCICYNEYAGSDFVWLPCEHFFCWKCMKTYSDIHISEGTVNKLQCPDAKCGGMLPPSLLKRLLGDKEYERWESLMLQKTLDSMSDIVYCPRCEMPCIEDEEQHAQCSKCFFSFCTLCQDRRHVGTACLSPELKLQILQERQNSSNLRADQRRRECDRINELLSLKEISRDSKQCPSCKMAISKIEGCNKMTCGNCGKYFCYLCNQEIDGYEHFRGGACQLFPQEAIDGWERMNARQVVGHLQADRYAAIAHYCPNCHQRNEKVDNNNHIFCMACKMHYCYLCRKIVRRSSQHYGPRGCKQHTVG